MISRRARQSGAVSLFVVIFTAILLSIITLSFVQLMLQGQQQATTDDLSQSAYDSAQAGVEDAKRLLLLNQQCQNGQGGSATYCRSVREAVASDRCDMVNRILGDGTNNETLIQRTAGSNADRQLNQAYTCVKITQNTDDYIKTFDINENKLIPLRGVGEFDGIKVRWFVRNDSSSPTVTFPSVNVTADNKLPRGGNEWQTPTTPALLRTQYINTKGSFSLSDLDQSDRSRTMFVYPASTGSTELSFNLVNRRSSSAPQQVRCEENFAKQYACEIVLKNLPGGAVPAGTTTYLNLGTLYNSSTVSIQLMRGGSAVKFNGVQPEVDSTGRANDIFRRVNARVELSAPSNLPQAALDLKGPLCKNLTVYGDNQPVTVGEPRCDPGDV